MIVHAPAQRPAASSRPATASGPGDTGAGGRPSGCGRGDEDGSLHMLRVALQYAALLQRHMGQCQVAGVKWKARGSAGHLLLNVHFVFHC